MRFIFSVLIGAGLGIGSVFSHATLVPVSLIFVLIATIAGIWSIGRMWDGKALRIVASITWTAVVLRAGFPGINEEYLIEGTAVGISLINVGFMALVIAILLPV